MLAIILFILKLLGILILVLLGLALLLLFLVLFAPIKYSSNGSKSGDILKLKALITYLNPFVRIEVHYQARLIVTVKILGITLYPKQKENNVAREKQEKKERVQRKEQKSNPAAVERKTSKKNSVFDVVSACTALFQENKELILEVLKVILKALKTVFPRKCYIKAIFGTGKADTTGFIYAAYCSLQDYLPEEVILEPVWIEPYLEGDYYLKGKIRLIHFVVAAVKILANRNVRLLYKKIRSVM